MTETLNGLLTQKPGRDPQQGEIKLFTIEHRKGKSGKPYIKIKNATAESGGQPYRVLSAEKTDFVDQHGNISFSVEIEASSSPPSAFQQTKAAMQDGPTDEASQNYKREQGEPEREYDDNRVYPPENAPQSRTSRQNYDSGPMSKDDYWRRKEDRDERREAQDQQKQRFIIRQHSQSMAIEVLKLKVTLNELTVEDLTPAKLRVLADYFDNDVLLGTTKNGN